MTETIYAGKMPILALRGLCVFPEQTVHFEVGREKSVKALEAAMQADQTLLLVPQKDLLVDDPGFRDLYAMGCIAKVKQVLKAQGENLRVLVTGLSRARITEITQANPYLEGMVESVNSVEGTDDLRSRALRREANNLYGLYLEMSEHPAQTVQLRMMVSESDSFIADAIAQNSGIDFPEKAKLLAQLNATRRLETAVRLLRGEMEMLRLEGDIQEKTRAVIDQNQKDYYLREQMRVIREELGEDGDEDEFEVYAAKIRGLHLAEEQEKKLLKDVDRLKKQPFGSSEGAVLRNYLDTVLELPWNVKTKERVDVEAARKVLERDHFGMEKVKERILETIAVRQMAPEMPPQILCLVGPPGVGKTSISYSIAKSLNRKMARISLGGVHDEADIRGHRKTYVGAMPGRIMAAITQAGSCNSVLLLDEIDKMGSDYRGDPSAALLEVLDAEQNHAYRDHYLEIPFDLSDVMFITTANTLSDRKRIIRALEVFLETGETITEHNRRTQAIPPRYTPLWLGLDFSERSELYRRIDLRVGLMLEQGLVEEIRSLLASGIPEKATAMQAIGYKEFVDALDGRCTIEEAADQVRQSSRRYAKRQLTWFRRNKDMHWLVRESGNGEILSRARRIICDFDK